jgi:hypothetical protein
MNVTTKTYTLPDTHISALEKEAAWMGMAPDKALAHAIKLLQLANHEVRAGLRMAFVNRQGQIVEAQPDGLPALD